MRRFRRRRGPFAAACGLGILLVLGGSVESPAQDMATPTGIQLPLIAKIMSFDGNFTERAGTEFVFAVVYQSGFRRSTVVKDEVLAAAPASLGSVMPGIPLRCVAIDLSGESDWRGELDRLGVDLLYVAPLRAFHLDTLTGLVRAARIRTVTGVPEYVESGVAVGIGTRGDKPQILMNLAAAKAEGARFSSQLLNLVKTVP